HCQPDAVGGIPATLMRGTYGVQVVRTPGCDRFSRIGDLFRNLVTSLYQSQVFVLYHFQVFLLRQRVSGG
ncbi:MAG: hypothetical protein OXQ89_17770, partial [Rhodospirillaceae bacterium]|nr:hypothetical protein [Rhodospirillaceae bacterium]